MGASYDDVLAQLSSGIGATTDDQQTPQPKSYDEALSSLSTGIPDDAGKDDWWGQYWGHLKDNASQAYHDTAAGGTPAMPSTDPMTMTKLISGRKSYLDDINAAANPDADADTKDRAATSARRLSRIDQVLSLMGQGPDEPMTDKRAADLIGDMPHESLMASDRYRQVYGATTPDMMSEDQRRAYAKDVVTKEANDLPWQRDSILAQLTGAPSGSVMADYGKNALQARQAAFYRDHDSDVPLPSSLQSSTAPEVAPPETDLASRAVLGLGRAAASTEETAARLIMHLSPQLDSDPEVQGALSDFHKAFVTDQTPEQAHTFGAKLAEAPGEALKIVAPAMLAGPIGAEADLGTFADDAWGSITELVMRNMPGAVAASVPIGQDRYDAAVQQGATPAEAALLVAEHAPQDIATNLLPAAAGGSTLARIGQGAAAQGTLSAASQYAETGHVDPGDVAIAAGMGGALATTHVEPRTQSAADVAAAREGFASEKDAAAQTSAQGQAEGRFAKVLDAIGDDPEAKARADWVLAQHNEGGRSALWTAAQLKQIAETGKVGDEEGYAAAQAAASPEAAEMGVTPASAAAERTSEEEAGQEVFGQRGGDAPPEGHELRFSLDSHAESGMPDRSRPVSEVEQLPALERPSVDHTDAEPIADVGRAYHEIAQEPSTHQLPPVPPDAKTLADITEAVAPDFRVRQIENADGNGLLYQIETPGPRGMKPVWLKVEPGGRLQLDAGRLTEGSGNGSRIYHIVNEFAHRNRLTAAPDDAGLSEVNTFRRTEQQLASAARTRDTSHLIPDYTQRLTGWKPGRPTRDNTRAESEFNTGLLAHRAMENAHEAVPDLDRMRYNFDNERYEWSDGQPVSAHDFARLAGSDSARASGVGSSSIKRAVYTASLLRERGQGRRPDVLAQASRERLAAGWRGAGNVAPDRLLYRLGEGDGERSAPIGGGEAHPVPEGGADGERVPEAEGSGSARGDGVAGELPPGEGAGVEDAARVDEAGAPVGGEKQPSLAQIQAGNYRKDHVRALGLDVTIENPRGSTRSGTGPDGRSWSRTLNHHYGYIRGTLGADGDHLDTFLGDQPDNPTRQVFVIDQHKPEGGFDEHKVMLGFRNQRAAEQAYASEYPKGWQGMGRVRAMSAPEFKTWLKGAGREEAHTGPVADNVPRVTLRHQQPDASVVHASAPVEGTSAIAARGDMPRLGLDNAGLPSQRRAVFDEVPRSGNVPDGHSSAVLRNVYDLNADPRKLMDRARAEVEKRGLPLDADHVINEFERQVVANGFDGYRSEGKVAVLGHDVPVARSEHEQHLPENENTDRGPAAPEGAVSEREGAGAAGRDGESGESDQGASADGERGEAGQGAVRPLSEQPAPREKVAYSGKGMSKSAAQGLVKLLKWDRSGDRIQVHQSIGDVPAELRNRIEPGFRDKVHGFYDPKTGTAHVIADKMTTPKELYRTLTEEHLGHGGLRKVFNTRDLNEMLDRAWGSVPKDERAAIARDYELDASKPEHRREIAEEYLAKLEPDGRSKTTFEKFRDWFNSTSRKMGRDVDYSPSELRAIMAAAHDHQRAGLSPSLHSRSAVDLVTPRNGLDGGYKMGKDGPEVDALKMRVARQKGTAEQEESMARTMATPHEDLSLGDRARAWLAGLKATGWEGAKDAWHGSLQGWLDAGNQVKRIEHSIFGGFLADASESPYKMYNLAKNSHAVMAAVMKLGVPEYRDGAFQPTAGRKGVFEIFRPLYEHQSGKSLMPLWEFYASAKRASRLINEKNINGDSRENNFSQQDIDRGLALEKQYPEFKTVADNFDTFNKQLLDLAADRGAISPEEAAAWKAHFYVPFMRAVEDVELAKAPKNLRGSAASNQKIYSRRLTGSENKVDSVFENILANTSYILDRTMRQEFMNRLLDMGEGVVLHKVPLANRAVHITNDDLARALWKGGVLAGTPTQGAQSSAAMTPHWVTSEVDKMTDAQRKQWTTIFERVAPRDPDVVPIMRDGSMNYYRVSDPLLLRTIGAMGHDSFGKVISLLGGAKRVVTWGVTKDPGFMAATWFRDALINWVGSHTPITPFVDNMKGAIASVREDPLVGQLMMAGVGVAPHYETQGTSVRRTLERKYGPGSIINTVQNGLEFYSRVGIAAEASSRLAIAKSVLDRGGSMAEAAYQAQDILNYSMRGDYTAARALAQTAPFWNAGMQGLYRFMRGAGIANAKAGDTSQLQSFALRGSVLVAATLANAWRNQDDPRYQRLSNDDKDRYWHFYLSAYDPKDPTSDAGHYKLPKPFEAGAVFGTLPERIVQRTLGNDTTKDTMKALLQMTTEEMRLNFLPQIVRQGIEQWANKDTSSWRAVVPAGTADQLPQDQFSPYTSWTAKKIANAVPEKLPWLNSPQRVEHLTRALAGTMGVYTLQAADWVARMSGAAPANPTPRVQDYPVLKRFVGSDDRSQYEDKMYEMKDEADATFNSFEEAVKRGDSDRAGELAQRPAFQYRSTLDAMSRSVSQIRASEKQVMQNPFLGPQEKREQLDAATSARLQLLDQYAPMLNQLHDQL